MKLTATVSCTCLLVVGALVALWMNAPPADPRKPAPPGSTAASTVDLHPAPPPAPATQEAPSPAVAPASDSAQIQELLRTVAARKAEYERITQDALRTREEWKKRWATDTAAFKAELAAAQQSIAVESQAQQEAMVRAKEIETRLRESIAAAKAEAEQEKRERAAQAAAPAPAPQQASDF